MNPYTILTRLGLFVGTMVLGAFLTSGITQILQPGEIPQSAAGRRPDVLSIPNASAGPGEAPGSEANPIFAAFNLVPASPKPLPSADPAVLKLAGAQAPGSGPSPNGLPRVPAVSQFDGSQFQGANCNLAAGAMLARLGWGIVTTGGILRDLQDDKESGTDLGDLATALWRGYGVSFSWGGIGLSQLRTLIGAGYGAVVHGNYGVLQPPYNKQPSFTGPHAIYIDAFFSGDRRTTAAYYVIDPLHKASGGYRGEWIPASLVEQFAYSLGGNRIMAAWAFPTGGTVPEIRGIGTLPTAGGSTPGAGQPEPDPADPPIKLTIEPGDVTLTLPPAAEAPTLADPPTIGGATVPELAICTVLPKPAYCPTGIVGRYKVFMPILIATLFPSIDVKFVDSVKPNSVMVGFTVSNSAPATVQFWRADGTGGVQAASSYASLNLPGTTPVRVAYLSTLAGTEYHFQVVAGGIFGAKSDVGTFKTAGGVKVFDLALARALEPKYLLASTFSVYSRLAPDALAPAAKPCASVPPGSELIQLGGEPYCLPAAGSTPAPSAAPGATAAPSASAAPAQACATVIVTYELTGMTGTQVSIRAYPSDGAAYKDGGPADKMVVEAVGPVPSGKVTVGCLTPGAQYEITLDIEGDTLGILTTQAVTAPSS